jgi:hypothetical protein
MKCCCAQHTSLHSGGSADRPGDESDWVEAEAVVERLAAIPGDEWVARNIMVLRLRTLLAKARGDEPAIETVGITTAAGCASHPAPN